MCCDLLDAIVGDVRDDYSPLPGRVEVDVVDTDALSREDPAAAQVTEGLGVGGELRVEQRVSVRSDAEDVVPAAGCDLEVGVDAGENLTLDVDRREDLVGYHDPEACAVTVPPR